uniref:Autophagy related 16 like 2 n=1 Tax=Tetraodon nigroviridis TaxID=99883 RepID=H3D0X0_TETNG
SRKQQVHPDVSPEEGRTLPVGCCLSARVPVRGLQVPDAHEQGINAASFSSAELLATGGTDRVVKLWDVSSGSLAHRGTLEGSAEGITCVDFSQTGHGVLAASYDRSALLWQRGSAVPKLTLTGHSRKVTAARFCTLPHQAATGSADRTIRHWDLHRAACVQLLQVASYCSDLVCADHLIISGHYDRKVRVWDSRMLSCIQELPVHGRITSLDINSDHRQLLSCCRDNSLQLIDLRRWSKDCMFFSRADGFICGSDSTKAVISPDGDFLAAGSANGSLYIWNVSTGKLETHLPGKHSSAISAVSWSPSGKYVVSVDRSRTAVLWS